MKHTLTLGQIVFALLLSARSSSSLAANLLRNSGFEDPAGWSAEWTIRDEKGGTATYHYHITAQDGGGHGLARPRSGANAIEIYSTDCKTWLAQRVHLEVGTFRMSAWARMNNTPDVAVVELRIGEKLARLPLGANNYKRIWADFQIEKAGEYEVSYYSVHYGIALDDLSLQPVEEAISQDASPGPTIPAWPVAYIDLYPGSEDRGKGIQYCLKDSLQWVSFAVTCPDSRKLKKPVMRITTNDPVVLSGLNEKLIHHYRMREEEEVRVIVTQESGRTVRAFALPRFVYGNDKHMSFGGLWLSNVPADGGKLLFEIVDGENGETLLGREEVSLVLVDPPARHRAPKKFYVLGYAIQNWQQTLDERLKAIPDQFNMMAFNVWSDYGLSAEKLAESPTDADLVAQRAYERGVRLFWPNFSSFIDTSGGGMYTDVSAKYSDADMHPVRADGTSIPHQYTFNYAANSGRAWMDSAIEAWLRTLKEPSRLGLPFSYTGYVNDGLEWMIFSYDPSTLAAFAHTKGVEVAEVTKEKLEKEWHLDWLRFNMDLYTRVVDVWAEQVKKANPDVKIINTADTYGPGGFAELSIKERMKWARSVDYNMPQWYGQAFYGSMYSDFLAEGEREGVFGKHNGGVDLIPLLMVSMGGPLDDPPTAIRFRILELVSASKAIKGFGYYIASNAFCDARLMVELSAAHTLLADIEDYYADGTRDDELVKLTATSSRARVHTLNRGERIALITVLTFAPSKGEPVTIEIDMKKLPNEGKGLSVIDRLTGRKEPLSPVLKIDTKTTDHAAVFEITSN